MQVKIVVAEVFVFQSKEFFWFVSAVVFLIKSRKSRPIPYFSKKDNCSDDTVK